LIKADNPHLEIFGAPYLAGRLSVQVGLTAGNTRIDMAVPQ